MRGIAAVMTTFGVGELSAINAIAGSFAEHVPVVHIVGAPSSSAQAAQRIVHHSLGDGQFTHFLQMHERITCARAALTALDAGAQIDRVLTAVRDQRLPGYLLLPADVGDLPIQRPAAPLARAGDLTDPEALSAFVDAATRLLDQADTAEDVSVLAGVLVHRLGAAAELHDLITAGPVPHATSLWGKSVVDESAPTFLGIYAGAASEPGVRSAIEDAAVLVVAGVEFTDLNSGFFSQQLERSRTIELAPAVASVGAATFAPVRIGAALAELAKLVAGKGRREIQPVRDDDSPVQAVTDNSAALSQRTLWSTVGAHLRPRDIVLADQGTSFYGMATHRLPDDVVFIGQPLWASIGYTLPALLGACLASPGRRGVLLIGDGAAQMTVQELSSILRSGISATVVIVDNDGYTVERAIHGPNEPYNDIASWDWTLLPALFAPERTSHTHVVETVGQLADALTDSTPGRLTLIHAIVPRMDVPDLLSEIARAAARANARVNP
ncbi:MAG: thiamine pyrophosphate protein binding domain protein [Pseudonocardiales bacterium]|nr:thiamine pyrophosphate protein binding domain protein [Pseudonocardiales bacterium]